MNAHTTNARCNVVQLHIRQVWGFCSDFLRTAAAPLKVDAILGRRGGHGEHEATLQAKTELMQLWDGMESAAGCRVLVMGATNRPWMIDEAVLRRFSMQYEIGLPDAGQRARILRGYLRKHQAETSMAGGVHPDLLSGRWAWRRKFGNSI